ncbi:hypothetical protein Pmani_016745 [Petrolisthes manimaculis]|uniref:Uncharacterized protein n=1 Tax=Petrolisthes manimaculis TaxID=1843537 RepID=A0AAE1PQZ4_9EUCA|nr:hypothetical protein Pmani_016745 [Petrolisthes manimaculis]
MNDEHKTKTNQEASTALQTRSGRCMVLYRHHQMTLHFEPSVLVFPYHPHYIIEKKFPSAPVYPPYWLHTIIEGHHVNFILDSTYPHNTMDRKTAERIGVTKYIFSAEFTVTNLRQHI